MSIIVGSIPSGTLIATIQTEMTIDVGLSIAASGTATITQADVDIFTDKSIRRVNRKLGTSMVIAGGDITPTPTNALVDLVVLQGECLLSKWLNQKAATGQDRGVKMVKLEGIQIQFDDVDRLKNQDSKYGFCAELEEAMKQYRVSDLAVNAGELIWNGNSRRFEDADHDGTTYEHRHYDKQDDGNKWEGVDPGDTSDSRFGNL